MDWIVYILLCADGTYYTGITRDLDRRVSRHDAGRGARYTRGRGPLIVVHAEKQTGQAAALKREAAIKKLTRRQKQILISGSRLPSA